MTVREAIKLRHSVRSDSDRKIAGNILSRLKCEMDVCNGESGLHIQQVH